MCGDMRRCGEVLRLVNRRGEGLRHIYEVKVSRAVNLSAAVMGTWRRCVGESEAVRLGGGEAVWVPLLEAVPGAASLRLSGPSGGLYRIAVVGE